MSLSAETYARQLKQLLPRGLLWRLEPGSWLSKLLLAISDELVRVDGRGEDLLDEWDPRTASECLSDWERILGLPDPLVRNPSTDEAARRAVAASKLAARGGQAAAYFVQLAAGLGFVATVEDGPDPYVWRMVVDLSRTTGPFTLELWIARAGLARAGDRVQINRVEELEMSILRAKPDHTNVWFDYTP